MAARDPRLDWLEHNRDIALGVIGLASIMVMTWAVWHSVWFDVYRR